MFVIFALFLKSVFIRTSNMCLKVKNPEVIHREKGFISILLDIYFLRKFHVKIPDSIVKCSWN